MPASVKKATRTKRTRTARTTTARSGAGYTKKTDKNKSYNRSNKERKFHDTGFFGVVPALGSIALASLLVIPTGVEPDERIGRRIMVTDIFIRGTHTLPSTADPTLTGDTYRFIVYLDRQANGATATVTNILATANFLSFNNLNNISRFRVLADKTTAINSGGATLPIGDYSEKKKNFFIPIKDMNLPIEYSGSNGAIDKIRSNNIGVLVISEREIVETNFQVRVRYTD